MSEKCESDCGAMPKIIINKLNNLISHQHQIFNFSVQYFVDNIDRLFADIQMGSFFQMAERIFGTEASAQARTEELKLRPQPAPHRTPELSAEYWQAQETKFRQRQIQKHEQSSTNPTTRPKSPRTAENGNRRSHALRPRTRCPERCSKTRQTALPPSKATAKLPRTMFVRFVTE